MAQGDSSGSSTGSSTGSSNRPEIAPAEIAEVEAREAQATLGNDIGALEALWSESFVVSSTENLILSKSQALNLFRAGRIRLKTFERRVSKVAVMGDVALATGNENFTVKDDPSGKEPPTSELFVCSYMNAWKREGAGWKLIGRHVGLMARMPSQSKS
jgi:ketosteroid isomerase-like protein